MFSFTPSLEHQDAAKNLQKLFSADLSAQDFQHKIQRLQRLFNNFADSCPSPWTAPGLRLTAEIHYQSELWLPLAEIRPIYERFYRSALVYTPILSSTPFANASSWADIVSEFPAFMDQTVNPAALLKLLLTDSDLRTRFLFHSFLPRRFYGEFIRYPAQETVICEFLARSNIADRKLRCLDAACGDGAGSYGLARLLLEQGWKPALFEIEGWTLDPLEIWSAAHAVFPHNSQRETAFREWTSPVFRHGASSAISFKQADLCNTPKAAGLFDVILCNGLLGGPIVNRQKKLESIVKNLVALLRPGGLLLAANHFHGGWKKYFPENNLGDVFHSYGLTVTETGEGISGLK